MMLCTKRAENLILDSGGTVKSSYVIPTDTCICKGKTNQKFVKIFLSRSDWSEGKRNKLREKTGMQKS